MINKNNVNIIIPFLYSSQSRFNNLKCVLSNIEQSSIKIILCEQHSGDSFVKYFIKDHYQNVEHIEFISNSYNINKSKLINLGVKASNCEYIWELDSDVILKWDSVLNLANPSHNVIQPFNYIVKLDRRETEFYMKNFNIKIKKGEMRDTVSKFGPLSFIIKKEVYVSNCGMNEKFEGWGWEDLEFARRIEKNNTIFKINSSYGIHLWHPIAQSNEQNNLKILKELERNV